MRNIEIATRWLHQAEPLCLDAGLDYIDVIIDRAGTDYPITEAFQQISPAVRWASLLDGTPEEDLLDDEPVLVRLHWSVWQHKDLLGIKLFIYGFSRGAAELR